MVVFTKQFFHFLIALQRHSDTGLTGDFAYDLIENEVDGCGISEGLAG